MKKRIQKRRPATVINPAPDQSLVRVLSLVNEAMRLSTAFAQSRIGKDTGEFLVPAANLIRHLAESVKCIDDIAA